METTNSSPPRSYPSPTINPDTEEAYYELDPYFAYEKATPDVNDLSDEPGRPGTMYYCQWCCVMFSGWDTYKRHMAPCMFRVVEPVGARDRIVDIQPAKHF